MMEPTVPSPEVFVSYNHQDRTAVLELARRLRADGVSLFLDDEMSHRKTSSYQPILEAAMRAARYCMVCVGDNGLGDFQKKQEILWAVNLSDVDEAEGEPQAQSGKPGLQIVPVLLPTYPRHATGAYLKSLSLALSIHTAYDLRDADRSRAGERYQMLLARLLGRPAPPAFPPLSRPACPYVGLDAFNQDSANRFFGRTDERREMRLKLRHASFLAVTGPSGCGKSSLVRAGLIPDVINGHLGDGRIWHIKVMRPSAAPLTELAALLSQLNAALNAALVAESLRANPARFYDYLTQAVAPLGETDGLLLVVDQFEEIFTLCQDDVQRAAFIDALLQACRIKGRFKLVLTLRTDYLHRCRDHAALMRLISQHMLMASPLVDDYLREAIIRPAELEEVNFESGLVDQLLADAEKQPNAMPLLEYALMRMWDHLQGRQLVLMDYHSVGRIRGAVAEQAKYVMEQRLSPEGEPAVRRLFLRLVRVEGGSEPVRWRCRYSEVVEQAPPAMREQLEIVVEEFRKARLLTLSDEIRLDPDGVRDTIPADPWVDVAHEALIKSWPLLDQWLETHKDNKRVMDEVRRAFARWTRNGCAKQELLAEGVLREAADLMRKDHAREFLNEDELHYVRLSILRNRRRRMIAIGSIATILLVLIGALIVFLVAENRVKREQLKAQLDILCSTNARAVGEMLDRWQALRSVVTPQVRQRLNGKPAPDRAWRLRLALLAFERDESQVAPLYEYALDAQPAEIAVLRPKLAAYPQKLSPPLWAIVTDAGVQTPRRLRAAALLAGIELDQKKPWPPEIVDALVARLLTENPLLLDGWLELLAPAREKLLDGLVRAFRNPTASTPAREAAGLALSRLAQDRPDLLAELLPDSTEQQFEVILAAIRPEDKTRVVSALSAIVAREPEAKMGEAERSAHARRRALAATAILRLRQPDQIAPLLRWREDGEAAARAPLAFKQYGVAPGEVAQLLTSDQQHPQARYTLLLTLGEYDRADFTPQDQQQLRGKLIQWYRQEPSAAVHGAAGWLLRRWQEQRAVEQADREASPYDPASPREWFVHSVAGVPLTFVIVHPGEFQMGSTSAERKSDPKEQPSHRALLARPFAICDREVTVALWRQYDPSAREHLLQENYCSSPENPALYIHWSAAVEFCRWLSRAAGMSEAEQFYADPGVLRQEKGLWQYPPDWPIHPDASGFRLPSELEWECAARAGTTTAYFFGSDEQLLDRYAIHYLVSRTGPEPVAQRRPSPAGLFDIYGNAYEWTNDWLSWYAPSSKPLPPQRVSRGGAWDTYARQCRSAYRYDRLPNVPVERLGLRVAFTLRQEGNKP